MITMAQKTNRGERNIAWDDLNSAQKSSVMELIRTADLMARVTNLTLEECLKEFKVTMLEAIELIKAEIRDENAAENKSDL